MAQEGEWDEMRGWERTVAVDGDSEKGRGDSRPTLSCLWMRKRKL